MTNDFPVLSAGPTPHTPRAEWDFTIRGSVDQPVSWTWVEFLALPSETPTVDVHCVMKWSKLDTTWRGDDEPGFWETYGYHDYGDPWNEQRYRGD